MNGMNRLRNRFERKLKNLTILLLGAVTLFSLFVFVCFIRSPLEHNNEDLFFTVSSGWGTVRVAEELSSSHLIPSSLCAIPVFLLSDEKVKAGTYRITFGETRWHLLQRILNGAYGDVYNYVTFPEGGTLRNYVGILMENGIVNEETSLSSKIEEGFFYPDTYALAPGEGIDTLLTMVKKKFNSVLGEVRTGSSLSLNDHDAVVLASLVEKEAGKSLEEKRIIAGILLKRLEKGMPLQVDAPFLYEREKGSAQLTNSDLQQDSPYNTYTRKGLPRTAIGNPGRDALYAVFHPLNTSYWFYLHGNDGRVHYARTYTEHLKNKRKYLR